MADYMGYIKSGEILIPPSLDYKHHVFKCNLCEEYYKEFDEFFYHYLSHKETKFRPAAAYHSNTLAGEDGDGNDGVVNIDVKATCGDSGGIEDQEHVVVKNEAIYIKDEISPLSPEVHDRPNEMYSYYPDTLSYEAAVSETESRTKTTFTSKAIANSLLKNVSEWNERSTKGSTDLKDEIKSLKDIVVSQNAIIISAMSEIKTLVKANLCQRLESAKYLDQFPICSQTELENIEFEISDDTKEALTATVKNILSDGGLKKNLKHLFDIPLLLQFNIDGRQGKKRLLDYPKFLDVIYRSVSPNVNKKSFLNEMRKAIRLVKNQYYKNECVKRGEQSIQFFEKN